MSLELILSFHVTRDYLATGEHLKPQNNRQRPGGTEE